MKLTTATLAATVTALATASPTPSKRQTDSCGQWDTIETGDYTIYNNLWGQSHADSGSQCFGLTSATSNTLAWHATWTWVGGQSHVKSYPNVVIATPPSTQISSITSIDTAFAWSYTGDDLVANVAYDVFTSSTADGHEEFELMVWLAALGSAGPISSSYGADGNPVPIATVTIAGVEWELFEGPNGQMTVYSFLPADRAQQNSFEGDLMVSFY